MEGRRRFVLTAIFSLAILFAPPLFSNESGEEETPAAVENSAGIEIPDELKGVQDVMNLSEAESAQEISEMLEESLAESGEPKKDFESFIDSVKKIRMFQTQSDVFSAVHKDSGNRVLTSSANGKVQRRFYSEGLRLEKVEYWKMAASSGESGLERVVTYNAGADGGLSSVFEKNYAESTETRTFFLSDGQIKSRRKNFFNKEGALESFEIYTCAYDSSARLVKERLQKYSVDKKSVALVSDELYLTKYAGKNIAESSYYKNSILRVRTFYIDGKDDEYVRATYFDGGIIVRDFYRGNMKVSSAVDNGGTR